MADERTVLGSRVWSVRVTATPGIWWAGVWRPTGTILDTPENVSRQMIESGQAVNVAGWPQQGPTLMPWSLQNVTPGSSPPSGAGVNSINGIDGDITIAGGANITVTTAGSTITVAAPNVVPTTRQVIAGPGLSGGGALMGNVTLSANVLSVFGRTGAITAQAGDYNASQITISPAIGTWTTVQQAITALSTVTGTPAGANGQVQFNNSGAFGASATLYWDNVNGRLAIGSGPPYLFPASAELSVTSESSSIGIITAARFTNDTLPPGCYQWKSRGTLAAPLPVQAGDFIFRWHYAGNSPSMPGDQGAIQAVMTDANLADMLFYTNDGTDPNQGFERVRITSGGNVGIGTGANPTDTLTVTGPCIHDAGMGYHGPVTITSTQIGTNYLTLDTEVSPAYVAIKFVSGGVYGAEIGFNDGNRQIQIFDQANQTIASMVIDMASVNQSMVGINKNAPAYTLDVGGDCNITGQYRVNGVPLTSGTGVAVGPTAPVSPAVGQLWWDTTNIRLMIWNGVWIQAA